MKTIVKPLILLVLVISFSLTGRAINKTSRSESNLDRTSVRKTLNDEIIQTSEWTVYKDYGSILIEYKFSECHTTVDGGYDNLNVALLRFTNLTKKKLEVTWSTEYYFDGECTNCDNIDSEEHAFSIILDSKEVKEGQCDTVERGLGIASNFIKLYPGMTETKLTNFKLVNLQTKVIK
ncbi:MAG: hypothetical protein HUJ25_08590 [Crocinitomicaceae bacterium]|nr:hypothetical protein [Crocinitomicaceae bacterium]